MADPHNLAASTVAEEKEGPLGEKQKIVFRNSDETLQGRSHGVINLLQEVIDWP